MKTRSTIVHTVVNALLIQMVTNLASVQQVVQLVSPISIFMKFRLHTALVVPSLISAKGFIELYCLVKNWK